jgi:hypothetical protein
MQGSGVMLGPCIVMVLKGETSSPRRGYLSGYLNALGKIIPARRRP